MATWAAARARLLNEDPALEHDEAALHDLLGPEEGDVRNVLARLLRGAVHAGAMAASAGEMADTIKGRQERYKRRAEAMRSTAYAILDAIGEVKVELPDLTASIRAGTTSVVITDPDAIPDIYVEVVTTRKPDKATILSVLRSGGEVPGCEKSNGIPTLSIRQR
jgi:hypothetical protein